MYKRTRNEFNNCRQALLDQSVVRTKQMVAYQTCLDAVRENKIAEYQLELAEVLSGLQTASATEEFDSLKEFLENSAQTAIYIQSCQMSTELHVTMYRQIQLVQQSLETLREYGEVTRYHPASVHMSHRIAKYSDWCRFLAEHQSVQDCRDVVTQFQMSVGKNAINKVPLPQVVTFSYQLQTNIRDGQFKLQKTLERYSVETEGTATGDDMGTVLRQYKSLYDNARAVVQQFGQENATVLHLAVTNVLCDLNNRLLLMENAAASSGDNLIELTFNGNWFLDEIYMHASIMAELVEFSANVNGHMNARAMHTVQTIYGHLREINATFASQILGDAIYGIIGEDKSVLEMISTVSSLQEGRQSIPEILTNLNLHLRRSARIASGGTSSPSITSHHITAQACADVKDLRRQLSDMIAQFEQIDEPNAGQKLFLELNGMFDKLEMEHGRLLDDVNDLVVPENWRKIKQIKDSMDLAVSFNSNVASPEFFFIIISHFLPLQQTLVLDETTRSILSDIFVVKRVETMIEVFTLILQLACSFKGTGICPVYSDELLCRPVRKFLADFVWRQMLGLQSFTTAAFLANLLENSGIDIDGEINLTDIGARNVVSMDEMCGKAIETISRNSKISPVAMNRATALCWNLDVTWRKFNTIQNIQRQIQWHGECLNRSEHLLAAHLWQYEEALATQPTFTVRTTKNRAAIMHQLTEATQTLVSLKTTIQRKREELMVLVTAITQRLKWAVGANPDLNELMVQFGQRVTLKRDLMDKACLLATITLKHCASVLHYEKLRISTIDALDEDQRFLDLVSRWEKSCMMAQSCSTMVTPTEEALVELLDPEGPIDRAWLNNVASLIDDMTDQIQQEISSSEKEMVTAQDDLQSCSYRLRALMATHHRIAGKVLHLLKSLYRVVDDVARNEITEHLDRHNALLITITELHGHVLSKDFTEEVVNGTLAQIAHVLSEIKEIFDKLITIDAYGNEMAKDTAQSPVVGQLQQEEHCFSRPESPSRTKIQKGQSQSFTVPLLAPNSNHFPFLLFQADKRNRSEMRMRCRCGVAFA